VWLLLSAAFAGDAVRWSALPNASYDSDDGLGFGARLQVDWLDPTQEPYRASLVAHAFATTNGYHHHRVRFDLVGLGPQERGRVYGHFAFRAWLNDGYWGIGNGTVLDGTREADGRDDPDRTWNRYRLVQPFGHLTWRRALGGPWASYVGVEGRWSGVEAYPGSLLEEEAPFGVEGGGAGQVGLGLLYDTRTPEITPDAGVYVEASGRVVVTPDTSFGGPLLVARGYRRIGATPVTLTGRVMVEYLAGEVPFYEMVHWGGFVPTAGFGGGDTLRGVSFGRWRAPGKALANGELRLDVLRHPVLKQELRWQVVPWADVGAVYGAEDPVAGPTPVHPALGLGVRPIWGETLVGRLDTGVGLDHVREADGSLRPTIDWGFYLLFDHLY